MTHGSEKGVVKLPSVSSQQRQKEASRLVRELRTEANKTQEQLANELNREYELLEDGKKVTRYKINRIEKGHEHLGPSLAIALDKYAEANDLATYDFRRIVADLKAYEVERERGVSLGTLLNSDEYEYEEVIIIMCDLTDFAHHVRNMPRTRPLKITLIVPSRQCIEELFSWWDSESNERRNFFDDYDNRLNNHIRDQILRMYRIAAREPNLQLLVYRSSVVLNSAVITTQDTRSKCIYWPNAPFTEFQLEPQLTPSSDDTHIAYWHKAMVNRITSDTAVAESPTNIETVSRKLVLGDVALEYRVADDQSSVDQLTRIDETTFCKFLMKKAPESEFTNQKIQGTAVALILPYMTTVESRRNQVQILLRWWPPNSNMNSKETVGKQGRLAFISRRICSSNMWTTLDDLEPRIPKSTKWEDLILQTKEVSRLLDAIKGEYDGCSIDEHQSELFSWESILHKTYINAAAEELTLFYGLNFPTDEQKQRIKYIPLTDVMISPNRTDRSNIFPRLYAVELAEREWNTMMDNATQYFRFGVKAFDVDSIAKIIEAGDDDSHEYADCLGHAMGQRTSDAWSSSEFPQILRGLANTND